MSISAISSNSYTNPYATIKDDFGSLSSALKSGSVSDAQKAYATLKSDTASQSSATNNPMTQDLTSLGSSLDSGSLADAQQKFAEIQKHMKGHGDFARQQVALVAAVAHGEAGEQDVALVAAALEQVQRR